MSRPWAVTGAAGFLGSHVVEQCLARGIPVLAIDDLSTGPEKHLEPFRANRDFTFLKLDIRDTHALNAAFVKHQPEAAVHLAALHFIPAAQADPAGTISLNVHGTQCVLSACRQARVEKFWFASTGDVYAPAELAHREEDAQEPFNIYGLSKWLCEKLIGLESRQRPEAAFIIGRLFNLVGPHETNPHILPEILAQIRARPGQPLRLGNLWPKRDLVPVSDAARALIEMLSRAQPGLRVANVATGAARSMDEVISTLGDLLGRPLLVEQDPQRVRAVERPHLQANVARLNEMIGWAPSSDLTPALRSLLESEGFIAKAPDPQA